MMEITESLLKRFWEKVDQRGPDECWEWVAGKDNANYGILRVGGRNHGASRISWEIHFGPIPEGLFVCHSCDNPPCVNPRHLWTGTNEDNIRDRHRKGRSSGGRQSGETNPQAKLTSTDVKRIRLEAASGRKQVDIAQEYQISQQQVSKIVLLERWRNLAVERPAP